MSSLPQHYMTILQDILEKEFLPHLPPLLDQTRPADEQRRKNLSRAFSAFAIHKMCSVSQNNAAKSVVDDFDDYGVDAIYYDAPTETIYLVQAKLKAAETFNQGEALAFCQGIRKLISLDFDDFNQNVQNRLIEIEEAVADCSHIQLVVAHTGSGISHHAKSALDELIADEDHGEGLAKSSADKRSARLNALLKQLPGLQVLKEGDGRPRRDEWDKAAASARVKTQIVEAMCALHSEREKVTKANVARRLELGSEKTRTQALRNKLAQANLDWDELLALAELYF